MTRGLVLAADGFSESQLEYAYHRLREDAVLVDVASPGGGSVRSARDAAWDTAPLAEIPAGRHYDLVVIPGGTSADRLAEDDATRRWLADHVDAGGIVCAVAEGVAVLAAMGLLDGRMATGPESIANALDSDGAVRTGEAVTIDGTLVTVRDTDALPFGIAAALGSVAIPQDPASQAIERPHWGGHEA